MAAFSSRQWVAITGSIVLFASLFLINRKAPASSAMEPATTGGHASTRDFNSVLDESKRQIPPNALGTLDKMEAALNAASGDARLPILKSMVDLYDSVGGIIPGTYYVEQMAIQRNSADLWYKAADRYFSASDLISDQDVRLVLIRKALECYTNCSKIDTANLDTKVGIGKCMVEASGSPMQGIGVIKGVIQRDSNNLNAQFTLGQLSIQSNQLPNAIYRFNRVLQINPSYSDAYLYLEEVYEKSGNKQEAVRCLEKYSTFATDKKVKDEIKQEIKKLQNDTLTNQ